MPRTRRRAVSTDKRFRKTSPLSDYGTPERWQHSGRVLEFTERAGVLAVRATEEHTVDILVLRGLVTAGQREAAMKLKLDYQRAGLAPHVTSRYTPTPGGNKGGGGDFLHAIHERSAFEEAAYQRWRNAIRALGIILSGPIIAAICHDLTPTPKDILALQVGLEKLMKYYGMKEGKQGEIREKRD